VKLTAKQFHAAGTGGGVKALIFFALFAPLRSLRETHRETISRSGHGRRLKQR